MDGTSEPDATGFGVNNGELHPLKNSVVLHEIFSYFGVRELKSIRMTCRLWQQESLKQWGKLAVLELYQHKCVGVRCYMLIAEFSGLINSPGIGLINGGRPYTNYMIRANSVELALPPYQQLGPEYFPEYRKLFWSMCGPHITYLNLEWTYIRHGRMVDGLKWILLKACPNLTELALSPYDSEDDFDKNEKIDVGGGTGLPEYSTKLTSIKFGHSTFQPNLSKDDARAMINLMPNLKSLKMDILVPELLKALKTKMNNGNYIKLQEITLDEYYELGGVHFELLREYVNVAKPSFRTVTLKIYLYKVRESPFHFHRWLGSLGAAVEKLDLTVGTKLGTDGNGLNCLAFVDMTGFSFASLRSLKLELSEYGAYKNSIQFDFRALKGMPNLWELYIVLSSENKRQLAPDDILKRGRWNWEENRYDNEAAGEGDDPTKIKLDRLEIFQFTGYPSKESLKLFWEWMPNVRNLKTILDTETYKIIFQMWPNLRKVTVDFGSKVFCPTVVDRDLWRYKNIEVTDYEQDYFRDFFCRKSTSTT